MRAARGLPVDATPVWFMRQAGRCLPEYRAIRERATLAQIVGDAALCAEVSLQPVDRLGVDAAIIFADITTPLPGAGIAVDLVDGVGPVIAEPIRTVHLALASGRDRWHDMELMNGIDSVLRQFDGDDALVLHVPHRDGRRVRMRSRSRRVHWCDGLASALSGLPGVTNAFADEPAPIRLAS